MNSVYLMGRLGADPETKSVGDTTVTSFSMATSKKWKDKSGEMQEKTEWHRCTAWGRQGEVIQQYFTKGKPILVMGEINYRTWEKDDGTKGYATDVRVNSFEFLPSVKDSNNMETGVTPRPDVPNEAPTFNQNEEIPF
jgi:single-strand DNA-binding protein